jgi:hypothetical protein
VTADEIMHVLRLTAMGRIGHPEQQRLCEALEKLMAGPVAAMDGPAPSAIISPDALNDINAALGLPTLKRTRKTKAE